MRKIFEADFDSILTARGMFRLSSSFEEVIIFYNYDKAVEEMNHGILGTVNARLINRVGAVFAKIEIIGNDSFVKSLPNILRKKDYIFQSLKYTPK